MNSNKLIAVDLGSSHISTVSANVLNNDLVTIYSEESKPSDDVRWGIVVKPTGAAQKVSELLKLLRNSSKLQENISHVSVTYGAKSMKLIKGTVNRSVGNQNVISENFLVDMMEECKKMHDLPDSVVFDIIPAFYIVDGKETDDPIGENAVQITGNYNVVVGNPLIKAEMERCFDRTGIVLEHTPTTVEALSKAVLSEKELKEGCALINLGASTTTLAVYHDEILRHLMVVPLGANNITKDIQETGISELNAERLKCLKGSALASMVGDPVYIQVTSAEVGQPPVKISTDFLANIIEARLDEMLQPIMKAIEELPFELDHGIVLTGGGAKLTNIIDFISEKTDLDTRLGSHSRWLTKDTNAKFHEMKYAQLVGTILLTHEYRKDHPIEKIIEDPKRKPKLPSKFSTKIADIFIEFFDEKNENKF